VAQLEDQIALPDIFDEVEEDLRAERAKSLGRRYAGAAIAAVALILGATFGYVIWQQRSTDTQNAAASRFLDAAKLADHAATPSGAADGPAAEASLAKLAADAPAGYQVLARLRLAALQWQLGQTKLALATWQSVTDDTAAPQMLRDLATLTSAQRQVDTGNPNLVRQQLESLTGPDNPWRSMAEQVIALLDLRTGDTHDAAIIMRRLSLEPGVPQGIRTMAADLLTTLPPDATKPTPATPAKTAPSHG
jgi:hypothetical protein